MRTERINNDKGFTLIEMIVVLVLGAVVCALAGLAIINVTNGLLFTKQNAATALKAQAAMSRLDKEFHIITSISDASTVSTLQFTNDRGNSPASFTLAQNGSFINLTSPGNSVDPLIDNVAAGSLKFYYLNNDGTTASLPHVAKIVKIEFIMTCADGVQTTFSMSIAPRPMLNEPA